MREASRDGLPRSSFAYAPSEDPSTWKLPYLTADGAPDPSHLPGAAAALSSGGFRGQKADIPAGMMAAVRAKIRQAYRRWGKPVPESLAEAIDRAIDAALLRHDAIDRAIDASLLREADDDHFYGAWHGGSKAEGGGPGRLPT